MIRDLKISGAYDGRSHPRNYGISSMQLYFSVKGPKGGTSCVFGTSWYLPENQQSTFEMYGRGYPFDPLEELMQPKGSDISYHSKTQRYEWEMPRKNCEITGGDCYCDGSSLDAQKCWLPIFLHEGSDGVFERLEQYYRQEFENGPPVDFTPRPRTFKD